MKVHFNKYQGTGNDFVMIDNRSAKIRLNPRQVKAICDRRFGIGADGIILLEDHPGYDFEMNYYNADGSQSFCGNGSRCIVSFARDLGIINETATYLAIDGKHTSLIAANSDVATGMIDVNTIESRGNDYLVYTGSPHYIMFTEHIRSIDIVQEARKIRYNDEFREQGVNVNFVEIVDGKVNMRTYERGVEDETLSCGTGVTAVAIAHCHKMNKKGKQMIDVYTRGGLLRVSLQETNGVYTGIQLIGPAEKVYEGEITL